MALVSLVFRQLCRAFLVLPIAKPEIIRSIEEVLTNNFLTPTCHLKPLVKAKLP
jgi:hypothetical protein